jgi:uncharacterized membrane protein
LNAKISGILGSAFLCMGFVPAVSILFTILGLIFLGISLNFYAKENEKIFNFFLTAALLSFVASVLFYFKLIAIITSIFLSLFSSNPIIPITLSIVFYFLIYYVLQIAGAVYFRKSFYILGELFNNSYFKTGGGFLIAGAVLNLFFIGLIIWTLGWLLIMIGFITMEEIIDAEVIEDVKLIEKD